MDIPTPYGSAFLESPTCRGITRFGQHNLRPSCRHIMPPHDYQTTSSVVIFPQRRSLTAYQLHSLDGYQFQHAIHVRAGS